MADMSVPTFSPDSPSDLWTPLNDLYQRSLQQSQAHAALAAEVAPRQWTEGSPSAPWGHYGAPYERLRFRVDRGMVEMVGLVRGGGLNQSIVTLPEAMRPANTLLVVAAANNGAATLYVHPDGRVIPSEVSNGASLNYVSLTGVRFPAGVI